MTRARMALLLALLAPACVGPQHHGHALLASHVTGTLLPGQPGSTASPRVGRASSWSWLFLVTGGDASIDAAMAAGGISTVHRVEFEHAALLAGFALQYTTIVYGE